MYFPSYLQLDSMDCGPTCLRMIAKFYGKSYSLQALRDKCHITREGVSMLGISDAAESIGFRTTGVKLTWNQLKEEMPLPCIAHWNQKHFVVVYAIDKKGTVTVADPAAGILKYSVNDFLKCWLQSEPRFELTVQLCDDRLKAQTEAVILGRSRRALFPSSPQT